MCQHLFEIFEVFNCIVVLEVCCSTSYQSSVHMSESMDLHRKGAMLQGWNSSAPCEWWLLVEWNKYDRSGCPVLMNCLVDSRNSFTTTTTLEILDILWVGGFQVLFSETATIHHQPGASNWLTTISILDFDRIVLIFSHKVVSFT